MRTKSKYKPLKKINITIYDEVLIKLLLDEIKDDQNYISTIHL